ncbi:MerR family transcriptional regulator [Niallia sp. FSL W8-0954]|jgi:DNA-binding transcriptional MerR regulator|uniref:MerR family transcriptional regulator n=1 Tax=Niallia sp. FSL W8-0954 TaxID=2975338 RepID=UPI0030FCF072
MLSVQKKELTIKEENSKLLSVKEAAEYINEGPGVVRNWLRELKTLIPVIIGENGYRYFDQKSLDILVKVKQMRNEKQMSLRQIEDELTRPLPASIPIATEATEKILQDLQTIKKELELQKNFNQVLVQQLKKQQEHIEFQQEHIASQERKITLLENPIVLKEKEEQYYAKSRKKKLADLNERETKEKKSGFIRLFSYR